MTGAQLIAAERSRQIASEGYASDHDDQHTNGELVAAACALAQHSFWQDGQGLDARILGWPWGDDTWKPKDPFTDLVRAGALIAAEVDRLSRAARP